MIGDFGGLARWHPAVEKLELQENGTRRRLQIVGGGVIVERLEAHDDATRSYRYTIVESPLPVKDYHSTLQVIPVGKGCSVHWSSRFVPSGVTAADADNAIRGIYLGGFEALRRHFAER